MVYHGHEKENHVGSHVKYYHCGKWHEGTLLEPVNYQSVVTKENPPAVLSTHTYTKPSEEDVKEAEGKVASGVYTKEDLMVLMADLGVGKMVSEVESVIITDAYDLTQEEVDKIMEHKIADRIKEFRENE